MAELDEIAQRLRAQGRGEATGGFTLDAERAREKLRQFQLADPHRYVLLMVQALATRAATFVHAEVDTSSLSLVSDAQPFAFEELSELYPLLFSDRAPPPGLRELALALNAAMALNPRSVQLECATADGIGVRLEQRVGRDDVIERVSGVAPGVRLRVRERFRPGLVMRFFALGSGVVREQMLLTKRCGLAGIEVRLNGEPVPPWQFSTDCAWTQDVVLDGRVIGRLSLTATPGPGEVELVRHHVWLSTHRFDAPELACIRAAVDASHLRTDASMSDVVQDEHYDRLLVVVGHARDRAVAAMAEDLRHASGAAVPDALRELLCVRLGQHLAAGGDPAGKLARAPMALRLWPCVDGQWRSTAEVAEQQPFGYVHAGIFGDPKPHESAALERFATTPALDDARRRDFERVFGERAEDRSPVLRRSAIREGNLARLRARPHPLALASGEYDLVETFDDDGFRGETGRVREALQNRSWVRVITDGCMLTQVSLDLPDGPHHTVVTGPLHTNEAYDDVVRDAAFAACMRVVLSAYARIGRSVAARYGVDGGVDLDVLFEHVHATSTPAGLRRVLASAGLRGEELERLLTEHEAPWRLTRAALSESAGHPFATLPLFEDGSGAALDLRSIAQVFVRDGCIRVISQSRPKLLSPPMSVVRAGERRLALLQAIFGERAIKRVGREFESWLARDGFAARAPVATPMPTACVLGPLQFGDDTVRGEVALLAAPIEPREGELELCIGGRVLTRQELPLRIGNMRVVMEVPDAWALPAWDGVQANRRGDVTRGVALALATVCAELVAADDVLAPQLRAAVMTALTFAFPRPEHVDAWFAFGRDPKLGGAGGAKRLATYLELLALSETHDPARVYRALSRAVADGIVPLPATIAKGLALRTTTREHTAAATACAPYLEQLMVRPVVTTTRGNLLSFHAIAEAAIADKRWRYLSAVEAVDVPAELDEAGVLDDSTFATMQALLGSRLSDAAPELRKAARRRAFEDTAPLASTSIPPGVALISAVIDDPECKGELGLPPVMPGVTVEDAAVTICTRGRPLLRLQPVNGTPWIGTIDTRDFGVESDYTKLSSSERVRVTSICRAHRAPLARAIAAAWDPASRVAPLLRAWALQLMTELLPEGDVSDRALANAGLRELTHVAFFVDADMTPRTLADLRTRLRPGGILPLVRLPGLRADGWLPLARDDAEFRAIAGLFRRVEDSQPVALQRLEFERAERNASPLPALPGDALVSVEIDARDLRGALWLSSEAAHADGIVLGREGKALSSWRGSSLFPCAGALEGEGVETSFDWSGCELSRTRGEYVKGRAAALYVALLEEVQRTPLTVGDRRAEVLRGLLLRLAEIPRAGRSWPNHVARRLFRELRELPLLPLANGHAIPWTTAMRERPEELRALGLWSEGDAPLADVEEVAADERSSSSGSELATPASEPPRSAPTPAPVPTSVVTTATTSKPATDIDPEPVAATPPEPPRPTRMQLLRAAVLEELRMLRSGDHPGPADMHLDLVVVCELDGRRVAQWHDERACIDARHPLVRRALDPKADRLLTSLIASAVVTVLNLAHDEVTDEQETRWLAAHAAYLRTALRQQTDA